MRRAGPSGRPTPSRPSRARTSSLERKAARTGTRRRSVRARDLFYLSAWDNYSVISRKADVPPWEAGKKYTGRTSVPSGGRRGGAGGRPDATFRTEAEGYGAVRAIDPKTGEKKWDFKMVDYTESGILTTASDLLFSGGREGHFVALDARTGELLWNTNLGGTIASGPITYCGRWSAVRGRGGRGCAICVRPAGEVGRGFQAPPTRGLKTPRHSNRSESRCGLRSTSQERTSGTSSGVLAAIHDEDSVDDGVRDA